MSFTEITKGSKESRPTFSTRRRKKDKFQTKKSSSIESSVELERDFLGEKSNYSEIYPYVLFNEQGYAHKQLKPSFESQRHNFETNVMEGKLQLAFYLIKNV